MFRPIELYVGLRYTRAKRRNHFISFISLTSMLGIALGVTALITVLSVMNGFEKELRQRILGMASHATVSGAAGTLEDWRAVADAALAHPQVVGVAPYVQAEGMLTAGEAVRGVLVRGVLPEAEPAVSDVGLHLQAGALSDLAPGTFHILLGRDLARILGVEVGDKVTLVAPQAKVTPAGLLPRLRRFTVVGIFQVGMYEYDAGLALVHLDDAAKLFQLDDAVSGVRLKLDDLFSAPRVAREVANALPGRYWVSDWTQQHANFFRAVKTEKTVMFVILTLIVAVAAFNIVSTLIMVVSDKEADIAILRTLGASPRSIMGMFVVQGSIIGVVGTLLGAVGGVALALNVEAVVGGIEQLFQIKFLSPDVYYISDLPSDLHTADVVRIALVALALSLTATLYPAWRASRTQPAEALRYE
jgi:lipoprotein-releasing system permease protein